MPAETLAAARAAARASAIVVEEIAAGLARWAERDDALHGIEAKDALRRMSEELAREAERLRNV
ncbi:MAG: hypothetical protein HZB38_01920 [Planctomycetes bacterium]|nr:hypothetical protein [Planctomycetota bacterium]